LAATVTAGATQITVENVNVDWVVGEKIFIGTSTA